jgi:hypothetical protein
MTQMTARAALLALVASLAPAEAAPAGRAAPSTPKEMVATYDALADTILGGIKTERRLVVAILNAAYAHARVEVERARQALESSDNTGAKAAIENLAAAVGQIGTEGDNAVAGIRKRLLQGGHHANVEGEAQGLFDEGYVIVTKTAKKAFLDASQALAMLARTPRADALETEWKKVEAAWAQHIANAK